MHGRQFAFPKPNNLPHGLYTHSNTYEKESPIQLLQNKNPGHKNKIPKLNQYTKFYQFLFYIQLWLVEIYKLFCSLFTFVVQLVLQNSHNLTPGDVTSLPIQKFTSVDYLSYLVMCIFQVTSFIPLKLNFNKEHNYICILLP